MTFQLMCVHITFSSVRVAEWQSFGKRCSLGRPYVLFVVFDYKYTNSRKLWVELFRKIIIRYNLIGYSLNVI